VSSPLQIARFDDWSNWWRKQYQHDQLGNRLRCQICGSFIPNVKEGGEVVAQGFSGGRVFELNGFIYVAVNVGASHSSRHEQVAQLFKFMFRFFLGHGLKGMGKPEQIKKEVAA